MQFVSSSAKIDGEERYRFWNCRAVNIKLVLHNCLRDKHGILQSKWLSKAADARRGSKTRLCLAGYQEICSIRSLMGANAPAVEGAKGNHGVRVHMYVQTNLFICCFVF